jgi:alpha-tubulin suppressor-like RCC1 family protein
MRIASGYYHTVLVSEDGKHVWTFGNNEHGQLGHGDKKKRNVPTEIKRNKYKYGFHKDVKIVGASCGFVHTVLLSDDGRIWTFGDNDCGQLGHGDSKDRNVPKEIRRRVHGLHKDVRIIGVSCGASHTVLLSDDGRIWTFGYNVFGQLGHGYNGDKNVRIPTEIHMNKNEFSEDVRIIDVSCGGCHTVLLSDDGRIWTFGFNCFGQLGHGDNKYRNVPTEIHRGEDGLPEGIKIVSVNCGRYHIVLISDDGRIWTFGYNTYGQLGHGDILCRDVPTEIPRGENGLHKDVKIVKVSCGDCHTILLSVDGRIWTFGDNVNGQLGHGDSGWVTNRYVPTEIPRVEYEFPEDVRIIDANCGQCYTVLLSDDGIIWTFGINTNGQLGHGDDKERTIPTEIQDLSLRNLGSLTKSANKT